MSLHAQAALRQRGGPVGDLESTYFSRAKAAAARIAEDGPELGWDCSLAALVVWLGTLEPAAADS